MHRNIKINTHFVTITTYMEGNKREKIFCFKSYLSQQDIHKHIAIILKPYSVFTSIK